MPGNRVGEFANRARCDTAEWSSSFSVLELLLDGPEAGRFLEVRAGAACLWTI
jgi:hypothetical protein